MIPVSPTLAKTKEFASLDQTDLTLVNVSKATVGHTVNVRY